MVRGFIQQGGYTVTPSHSKTVQYSNATYEIRHLTLLCWYVRVEA